MAEYYYLTFPLDPRVQSIPFILVITNISRTGNIAYEETTQLK
jgi:hypothetical protein